VQFVRGQAFIRKDRKIPGFEVERMPEIDLGKFEMTEQRRIREREKISSAERCAMALRDDFGYQVEYKNDNN